MNQVWLYFLLKLNKLLIQYIIKYEANIKLICHLTYIIINNDSLLAIVLPLPDHVSFSTHAYIILYKQGFNEDHTKCHHKEKASDRTKYPNQFNLKFSSFKIWTSMQMLCPIITYIIKIQSFTHKIECFKKETTSSIRLSL